MNDPPLRAAARGSRVAAGIATALSLAACAGPSPIAVPSTWQLAGSAGRPLPVVLASDSLCITQLLDGRLEFMEGDSYHSTYTIQRSCLTEVERLPDPGVIGRYSVRADTVRFLDPSGQATGQGVIDADSITVRGPLHVLVFRRAAADSL